MKIAWIYLDKKLAAVEAMQDYHDMEFIIANAPDDVADVRAQMTAVKTPTPSDMPRSGSEPHAGEARLAASLDEIDVLKERYRRALEYMAWFRPAWDALTDDERFILSEFYRQDASKTEAVGNVCDKLHIERTCAYKRKDAALLRLTVLLYVR